jgi:hypothetical protein
MKIIGLTSQEDINNLFVQEGVSTNFPPWLGTR